MQITFGNFSLDVLWTECICVRENQLSADIFSQCTHLDCRQRKRERERKGERAKGRERKRDADWATRA